jgi:hypothetical protein
MKRLRERAGFSIVLLSALLGVAAAGLWIQSYFYIDDFKYNDRPRECQLDFVALYGGLQFGARVHVPREPDWEWDYLGNGLRCTSFRDGSWIQGLPGADWQLYGGPIPKRKFELLGFTFFYYDSLDGSRSFSFRIPLAFFVCAFAIAPVVFGRRSLVRRRRKKLGRCENCGYDLRALSDRCPECGRSVDRISIEQQ